MKPLEVKTKAERHPCPECLSNLNFSEEALPYSSEYGDRSQTINEDRNGKH